MKSFIWNHYINKKAIDGYVFSIFNQLPHLKYHSLGPYHGEHSPDVGLKHNGKLLGGGTMNTKLSFCISKTFFIYTPYSTIHHFYESLFKSTFLRFYRTRMYLLNHNIKCIYYPIYFQFLCQNSQQVNK